MPERTASDSTSLPLFGRRREFLLSRGFQLRLSLWAAGLAVLLLVPLNLALAAATSASTERILVDAPELARPLEARDRLQARLVLVGSVVFVLGVFLLGVLEGHRTAGAARKLGRSAEQLGQGRFDARVTLRRGDSLLDLAARFNEMAGELRRRAAEDEQDLEHAAAEIERLDESDRAREVVVRLRAIATRRRDPAPPLA